MRNAIRNFFRARSWETGGAIAFALFVAWPLFHPGRLVTGFDTLTYSVPNQAVSIAALRAGHLPAWNPYIFGGAPHLANPQVGIFYPLKWASVLVSAHRGLVLLTGLHLLILALGMVVLAGGALKLRPPAALVAAVIATGSGVAMAQALHFEQILTIAWAPWVLAAVDAAASGTIRIRRGVAAVALTSGLMLLAGHQQPAYVVLALAIAWGLARCIEARSVTRFAAVLAGMLLALGLAAVQLAPTLELVSRSVRAGGLSIEGLGSPGYVLNLRELPAALLGNPVARSVVDATGGVEASAYVGAAGFVLALVGLIAGIRAGRRALVVTLGASMVVATVLAAGPATPLFDAAHAIVPGFALFRVPARWVLATDLILAVLASFGVDAIVKRGVRRREAAAVIALGAMIALLIGVRFLSGPPGSAVVVWLITGGAMLVTAALAVRPGGRRFALAVLMLLPVLELGIAATRSALPKLALDLPLGIYPQAGGPVKFLRENQGRALARGVGFDMPVYAASTLRPNLNATYGVRALDGYDGGPQLSRRWVRSMESLTQHRFNPDLTLQAQLPGPIDSEMLARFGVRWVLLDAAFNPPNFVVPDWGDAVVREGNIGIWQNPRYQGEGFLYAATQPLGDRPGATLLALGSQSNSVALVESDGPVLTCSLECGRSPVSVRRPRPERLIVDAESDRPTLLVVTEQWDPGWRAEVDGKTVAAVPVDGFMLGVSLPSGHHRIELTYHVPGLAIGISLTLVSLAITTLLTVKRRLAAS